MGAEITEYFTADDIREMLYEHAPRGTKGPQMKLAERIGMSPSTLRAIMSGERPPNDAILAFFGMERMTAYIRGGSKLPRLRSPYGAVVRKLRELEVGEKINVATSKRGALHAQAGRIGICIKTSAEGNAITVERVR